MGLASLICGGVAIVFYIPLVFMNYGVARELFLLLMNLSAVAGVVLGVLDILIKKIKDYRAAEAANVQPLPLPPKTIMLAILGVAVSVCALLL